MYSHPAAELSINNALFRIKSFIGSYKLVFIIYDSITDRLLNYLSENWVMEFLATSIRRLNAKNKSTAFTSCYHPSSYYCEQTV